jgi:ubiquinone/menaquinone biosynthesis C-methylase UbiE
MSTMALVDLLESVARVRRSFAHGSSRRKHRLLRTSRCIGAQRDFGRLPPGVIAYSRHAQPDLVGDSVAEVSLPLRLDRWYLGLHGLALLRSYPYGDPADAEERMAAMRLLLEGRGDPKIFGAEQFEVLELDEGYASWSATYDDPNPLIVAEERALLPILDRTTPGVAVDAATGTGRVAAYLRRRGHRVLACDRSAQMLRRAADRLEGASVVQADLLRLPVRDASVDLLTCSLALTHVGRLPAAFASFARVVRPGGLAVISDIHPFAVATGAQAFFRREDGSRAVVRNVQHWVSDYVASGTAAGFDIEGCDEVFIDDALLSDFAPDGYAESALRGLPFGLIWRLRRREWSTPSRS